MLFFLLTAFRTIYVLRKEELLLKHLIDSSSSESSVGRSVARCPGPWLINLGYRRLNFLTITTQILTF